ncbi:hypothetical protein ACOME3_005743 [Neoechinorhynchus agilis]
MEQTGLVTIVLLALVIVFQLAILIYLIYIDKKIYNSKFAEKSGNNKNEEKEIPESDDFICGNTPTVCYSPTVPYGAKITSSIMNAVVDYRELDKFWEQRDSK